MESSASAKDRGCQSPEEPGSPRGVASVIGTLSTLNSSLESARALSVAARDAAAPGALRTLGLGLRIAASDVRAGCAGGRPRGECAPWARLWLDALWLDAQGPVLTRVFAPPHPHHCRR